MLTLNDGRSELWQWDTGRTLTVDPACTQVRFSNKVFGKSIPVDVENGIVKIPDFLLQADNDLTAWAFVGTPENGYTKFEKTFKVKRQNKPADYVFTPTEQTTLNEILDRIEDLENRPSGDISEEEIKNAVNDYLGKNPISVEEKDPTVPQWAKQPEKPKYTAKDVEAIPENGDPKANIVLESVYCSDIVACSELAVQNSQNNAEYASFGYGGKTQSGNPVVECGDMKGNPVNIRNVADPEQDSDVTPMRWVKDHVDKHGIKVTGAEVGQLLKVKAVDENGHPTAWETADPASVGFRHIRTVTIPEDITTDTSGVMFAEASDGGINFLFDMDESGKAFDLNEVYIKYIAGNSTGAVAKTFRLITQNISTNQNTNILVQAAVAGTANASYPAWIYYGTVAGSAAMCMHASQWATGLMYASAVRALDLTSLGAMLTTGGFTSGSKFEFYGR